MKPTLIAAAVALLAGGCRTEAEPSPPVSQNYWKAPEPPAAQPLPSHGDASPGAERQITPALAKEDGKAIIADHRAADAFPAIPSCWLKRGAAVRVAYEHTSHGSQIVSGLNYLASEQGAQYAVGEPNGLALRDGVMSRYGSDDAYDLGYAGWSTATMGYLREHPKTDAVMWSWCGQVGEHAEDMETYLFGPAARIVDQNKTRFIYMTGHLDGAGPQGNTWRANDRIRQHVRRSGGVLFDFADIESVAPDGKAYPSGSDACEWCNAWCSEHPGECKNLPECAHSHGFNCVRKGKAYWWLVARLAGWNGSPDHGC